jgi:hypothetical protein
MAARAPPDQRRMARSAPMRPAVAKPATENSGPGKFGVRALFGKFGVRALFAENSGSELFFGQLIQKVL